MSQKGMWIIGYGSLIFKPPPLVSFRVAGTIQGFIRRFWQSSSDHRGTPEAPGRVVTLVSLEDLKANAIFENSVHSYALEEDLNGKQHVCKKTTDISLLHEEDLHVWGVAYYINPENVEEVKQYLDIREQDGYTLHTVNFRIYSAPDNNEDAEAVLSSLVPAEDGHLYIESGVYIGTIENESFVGPESIEVTAKVIRSSHGPSGDNYLYLHNLMTSVGLLHPEGISADGYLEVLTHLSTPK